jgi:hypothetical protein
MLTASDLIHLPYASDLTQAGIDYACRSLPYTYDRMGGSQFARLRRIVAGVAVELAFRRYLAAQDVPHDNLGATPFTDPDRYDVALGGRRCDLKSFQIFNRNIIRRLRHQPAGWLEAAALVPADQLLSDHLNDEDLYIFAFATALVTPNQDALQRALAAGQPIYLIHPFPEKWSRPERWASLGRLVIKAEAGPALVIDLGGQGEDRSFRVEACPLEPGQRVKLQDEFYTLGFIHPSQIPGGRLGVHSPALDYTYLIQPHEWGNIWVYGMEIILAGFMTRGEFRRRSHDLPANSRVLQYAHTRTKNRMLPIADLYPLADLLARVKTWAGQTERG